MQLESTLGRILAQDYTSMPVAKGAGVSFSNGVVLLHT